MRKKFTLVFISCFISLFSQNINEFHYDNLDGDVGEFVEVFIPNPQPGDLSLYRIDLYNGNGGASYDNVLLNNGIEITTNCFGEGCYYVWNVAGIQNGAPDGIALSGPSGLIEFLSYEGTFNAIGGPADGVTSTDIGAEESGTTPVGHSLALKNGVWVLGPQTKGAINPVVLLTISAKNRLGQNTLSWQTASEVNNSHFEIQKSIDGRFFESIGKVVGRGNSLELNDYEFVDYAPYAGLNYYRLKQVDYYGDFEYSKIVSAINGDTKEMSIKNIMASQSIHFSGIETQAYYKIMTVNGALLSEGIINSGSSVSYEGANAGLYIVTLSYGNKTMTEKIFIY